MKALVYKDFLLASKQLFWTLLMVAAVVLILALQGQYLALPAALVAVSIKIVYNSFAFDEQCQFEKFALSGPVTRTQYVFSKYALALLLVSLGGVSTFAMLVLRYQMGVGGAIFFGILAAGLPLIAMSMMLPLVFKLGVGQARLAVVAVYVVIFALAGAFSQQFEGLFETLQQVSPALATLISLGVIVLVCAASIFISDRIVASREY